MDAQSTADFLAALQKAKAIANQLKVCSIFFFFFCAFLFCLTTAYLAARPGAIAMVGRSWRGAARGLLGRVVLVCAG